MAAKQPSEASPSLRGALIKLVLAVLALLATAAAGALLSRAFFHNAPERAQQTVDQIGQQAQATATEAITHEVDHYYETERVIDAQTQEGMNRVDSVATSAAMDADLAAAGVDALCMHDSYRAVNQCPVPADSGAEASH